MRGLWLPLCLVSLPLWPPSPVARAAQTTPAVVSLAGLRTANHQGGFRAATYLPDGSVVLLEDQGDGPRLLKTDTSLSTVVAEAQEGAAGDHAIALASDGVGNVYVGGTSSSGALSGTPGALFPAVADASLNSFVAKFDSSLHLVFLSFLGAGQTALTGIAATGNAVYITGVTYSPAFPTTPGSLLPHLPAGNDGDGFVECFSTDGSSLRYATYVGGLGGTTSPSAIVADGAGAAYIAGSTAASGYPVLAPLQANFFGAESGFLTKLSPSGGQLAFSTLIAGAGISSLAADPATGDLLLTGDVASGQFPVTNALSPLAALRYQTLLRVSPDGQHLRDSVLLLAGTHSAVTPGPDGTAWITGPLDVPLSVQELAAGPGDSYALHLSAAGLPDAMLRIGGNPTTHPAVALLATSPGPAAISNDGSSVLLPATLTAATDPAFASTQIFDLGLTAPNALLPARIADLLPATCDPSLPCGATAGFLLQLVPGTATTSLALSLGDLPAVTVRNAGPLTAFNLTASASPASLVSDCQPLLQPAAQCGFLLTGPLPATLTVTASNAASLTVPIPANAALPTTPLLLDAASLDFGLVSSASPRLRTVHVTNLGTEPQTFASAAEAVPGNASHLLQEEASTCEGTPLSHTLPAGSTCTLTLALSPSTDLKDDGSVHAYWRIGARTIPVTGYAQARSVTLSTAKVEFGIQPAGPAPLPRFLYLSNTSAAPVAHASLETAPGSPFQVNDDCPSVLEPQSVCQIGILYNQSAAPAFDSLTLTLEGDLTVLLTGETAAAQLLPGSLQPSPLVATPSAIAFGVGTAVSGVSSAAEVVHLTNSSSASVPVLPSVLGDFLLDNTCPALLAPQGSCDLGVRFAPGQPGDREGVLTLSAGTGFAFVTVSLSGTASPLLDMPDPLDLGATQVAEPAVRWFEVQGSTELPLTVTSTGADFGVVLLDDYGQGHGTVAPTAFSPQATGACLRCWVGVQFLPQAPGKAQGTLTVSSTASGHPLRTALSATGLPSQGLLLTPAEHDFGAIPLHSGSASLAFVLTNQLPANLPLVIQKIGFTDDSFHLVASDPFACSGSLDPSASCRISVAFSPGSTDAHTGNLAITTDAGVATAALTGIGTPDPGLAISPVSLAFGPETQRTLTLSNTGALQLSFASPQVSNTAFRSLSHCTTLLPSQSCTVDVSAVEGSITGTLALPVVAITSSGQRNALAYAVPLDATNLTYPAALELFPSEADFGVTATGTLGRLRQFTLRNTSASAVALSFRAPHNFPLATPPACPDLPAGASCTFSVAFLPEAGGSLKGSLFVLATFPDGTPAGQAALYLQGYGQGPATLTIAAGTDPARPLSLGTVASGQSSSQELTLSNTGAVPLTIRRITSTHPFQTTTNCASSLPPGGDCQATVTYWAQSHGSSAAMQSDVGTVLVESDAQSGPETIYLAGSVAPQASATAADITALPVLALDQTALTFANTSPGQVSQPQQIVLSNTGTVPVSVTPPQAPSEFPTTTDCGTIPPGGSCRLRVSFQPGTAAAGSLHASTLMISSNAATSLEFVSLFGVSTAHPLETSADVLQFGDVAVGSSSQLALSIRNGTNLPVPFGELSISKDFSLGPSTCPSVRSPLPAGQSCTLTVVFTPEITGAQTGQLTLVSSVLTQPLSVLLSGVGIAGHLAVQPVVLDFGSVDLQATATLTLSLTNTGAAPLTALGPHLSGPAASSFAVHTLCKGVSLAPGASCALQVSFSPTLSGEQNATLTLASSDPSGPTVVALRGAGALPPGFSFTVNNGPSASAKVQSGGSAAFSLAAAPRGGFTSPLALSCRPVNAAPNTDCRLSESLLPIINGPATATVTLSTASGLSLAAAAPWGALMLGASLVVRRRSPRHGRCSNLWPVVLIFVSAVSGLLAGCGDGPQGRRLPYTPPGVYTYEVVAAPASGTVAPSAVTLTLTVK